MFSGKPIPPNPEVATVSPSRTSRPAPAAARLLPLPLLVQLIRMGDDALAEFLGQYVTWALEVYLTTRQGVQAMSPFNPFAQYAPGGGFSRMFGFGAPPRAEPGPAPA